MPRIILFAGAPSASSVDSQSCTLKGFSEPFHSILDLKDHGQLDPLSQPSHAVWRSLPFTRQTIHTGFSQNHNLHNSFHGGHADFFTTADVSNGDEDQSFGSGDSGQAILTQFCEESLAAHNLTQLSQLNEDDLDTTEETSFMTTSTTDNTAYAPMLPPPVPSHLSDLEDVPRPAQILSLIPQTVTLNIIVAVISIAQPRSVKTRWGKTLSLVEVLVGDETKSGFAVTFWLSSEQAMTSDVSKLRRQDVVLMENVALHVFRGKVYGQSLRKNLTRVSLLWRRDGGGYYSAKDLTRRVSASHPQKEKTRMVKDWVIRFVGRDPSTTTSTRARRKSWDKPPDDTQ